MLRRSNNENLLVKNRAERALGSNGILIPNYETDLETQYQLIVKEETPIKYGDMKAFFSQYPFITDKEKAWSTLHYIKNDDDSLYRQDTIRAIKSIFQFIPVDYEPYIWNYLLGLLNDEPISKRFLNLFPTHQKTCNVQ
jgi:hypothetical protein